MRAGTKENEDCKKLIRLMGCPVIEAPMEAEAQCAQLCKEKIVHASSTEDMDCITFGSPLLLRKMTFAGSQKNVEVQLVDYNKAISGLGLTHDEFVDLCIMMGCDYCDTIRGIGPKTALKLIKEHKTIEAVLKVIDRSKYIVPSSWVPNEKVAEEKEGDEEKEKEEKEEKEKEELLEPIYVQARKLFNEHEVLKNVKLEWKPAQTVELQKFLVEQGFNEERVAKQIEKLENAKKQFKKPQMKMDSFFGAVKAPNSEVLAKKRQAEKDAKKKGGKKPKTKDAGKNFFNKK